MNRLWVGWEFKKVTKKSEKHSFLRNLSVDSSADASADAPAIIVQLGSKLNTKMALDHPPLPTTTTRNFSEGSRHARRLRFGM